MATCMRVLQSFIHEHVKVSFIHVFVHCKYYTLIFNEYYALFHNSLFYLLITSAHQANRKD